MVDGNHLATEFILGIEYASLPPEVIRQAKRCLLDLIGVTLAGTLTRAGRVIGDLACAIKGKPEATVAGFREKAPVPSAVLVNTILASSLDFDDGYRLVKGHPGAFVVPAALALCERDRRNGKDCLAAIVAGYEIGIRAGIITHSWYHHYHSSGSWGGMGTFAAMACLLRLDRRQILNGLGISEFHGSIAPALRHAEAPSMLKGAAGWGAFSGAWATLLAQNGFSGIPSLLGMEGHFDLMRSLGKEFRILDVYFKPYACCRWAHPAIDGVLKIMNSNRIKPDQIRKVSVRTFEEASKLRTRRPSTSEEAQYSIPYVLAAAVVDGEMGAGQVREERLNDPGILAVTDKVEIVIDEETQRLFPSQCMARVILETDQGTYDSGLRGARGDPDQPFSDDDLKRKFLSVIQGVIPDEDGRLLIEQVDGIEGIKDLSETVRLLQGRNLDSREERTGGHHGS
jgi:2-methylcitrate dehydratase PrpD